MSESSDESISLTPLELKLEIEIKEEIRVEETNQLHTVLTIELPKCDTVNQVDVAMIASNNESSMKIESPLLEPKDHHKHGKVQLEMTEITKQDEAKQVTNHDEAKIYNTEEKISNMEGVVEKVVEVYITESTLSNFSNKAKSTLVSATPDKKDNHDTAELTKEIEQDENEEEEIISSLASPSQSQSSRATRWEALADIAAELPPSLTVDPLTGQIYALSK